MQTQDRPPVKRLIDRYEAETTLIFKPSRNFYQGTGINRIRFSKLSSGDKKPTLEEANRLTQFFNRFFPASINDLLN
ncbi:hypothetical protein [Runella sp.]|uniref:hypothetical protein n=1 Tax=Runella sp. TaxID=1960881 RepID=UPI003016E490